jgi:diacylglycerol kinase family enzyme
LLPADARSLKPTTVPTLRILLVVNAFASSVTARNTVVVHRTLSHGHQVDIVETNRRGHATRFAQDAARRGVDVVVAFGGDGTLNEVATGVAGSSTALGVLPGGSTNVFARTIGMPNDPVAAAGMLAAGLRAGSIGPIGLGRVNGRYFCFHTGVGYDAAVVRTVERRATWKRWIGHPLFITSALTTWVGYDRTHPHFAVTTPAGTVGDGYFTVVLNANPYTYLGNRPLDLSPAATLERGLVAVTFRTMSAVRILSSFVGALRGGGMTPSRHLDVQTDLVELTVEHPDPFAYQVDGDYLGETTRLQFHHVPAAVNLVRPAPSHPASGPQDS